MESTERHSDALTIEPLLECVEAFGKTSIELYALKLVEFSARFFSQFIVRLILLICAIATIICVNLGIALWLGELLGKLYYGFFLLGLFYFVLILVVHFLLRNWLQRRIGNKVIQSLLE